VTAFDVIGYPHHAGGLDNAVTVLAELVESLDAGKLVDIAGLSPITCSQRLGYLLELIGEEGLPEGLAAYVAKRKPVPALLPRHSRIMVSVRCPVGGFCQTKRFPLIVSPYNSATCPLKI
jgi:hypothetical protein